MVEPSPESLARAKGIVLAQVGVPLTSSTFDALTKDIALALDAAKEEVWEKVREAGLSYQPAMLEGARRAREKCALIAQERCELQLCGCVSERIRALGDEELVRDG